MTSNREIRILADANSIAQTAAAEFLEAARESVREKGSFSIALAGGSTPKTLYSLLASNPLLQAKVPWGKIQFFFGDERHVPPDHTESNFCMAKEAMLAKAPIDPKQVHRIKAEKRNARKLQCNTKMICARVSDWLQTSCLVSISCSWGWARRGTQLLFFPEQKH